MTDAYNGIGAYADALFMLAEELGETEAVRCDVITLGDCIRDNPSYLELLDTPALSKEERLALIDEAFSSFNKNLLNLIKLLAERRTCRLLPKIVEAFSDTYDRSRGIERVEAISAVPLTDAQTERLVKKLEKLTGKQIIVKNTHDPALLGGMKLRYLGIQLDGSVKTKLDSFEKSLGELVI